MAPFESHKNGTYQNLVPVLELADLEQFDCWNNPDIEPYQEMCELAELVKKKNPKIDEAIMYDFNLVEQELLGEDDGQLTENEILHFIDGLMAGYEFMIGMTTKINMIRHKIVEFENYMTLSKYYHGFVPLVRTDELDYFAKTIDGSAPLEHIEENDGFDSEDLLIEQYEEYVFESPIYNQLICSVKNDSEDKLKLRGCTKSEIDAHLNGFDRGLIHSFGMYLFSTEHQMFNSHR